MKAFQKHILFLFAGLIIFPSAVDFAHVFTGHQHDFCNHYADSHFHEKNLDCELFDFQKTPLAYPGLYSYTLLNPEVNTEVKEKNYTLLSNNRKLSFSLRAPPAKVLATT